MSPDQRRFFSEREEATVDAQRQRRACFTSPCLTSEFQGAERQRRTVLTSGSPEHSLSAAGSKGQHPAEMQIKKANVAVRQRSSGFLSESYFRNKQAFDGSRRRRRREVPYGTKRKAKRQKTPHGGRLKTSLKPQTAAAPQTSRRCNRRRLSPLPRLKQGRDRAG